MAEYIVSSASNDRNETHNTDENAKQNGYPLVSGTEKLAALENDVYQLLEEIRQTSITVFDYEGPEWDQNVPERM